MARAAVADHKIEGMAQTHLNLVKTGPFPPRTCLRGVKAVPAQTTRDERVTRPVTAQQVRLVW
jgi:hypothetical protein